ncbi:reverse transcriptase domain-containing protein [Tanacetum coccineum]
MTGQTALPSPDYVASAGGTSLHYLQPYVPEPVVPEFMPLRICLSSEEQPLPAVVSPTADSPGYIPESDPEGDPEEEDEEDPEEDPAYYPADIGDDDEEDEEEEHLAFADSTVVALPAIDRVSSRIGLKLGGRVTYCIEDRHIHHHLAVMVEEEGLAAGPPETSSVGYGTKSVKGLRHRWLSLEHSIDPQKVRHSLMHQERLVAVPRFGYVVAMLCSLLSIMGYSQLADCIDLLFCLATQYRSFVQAMINEGVTAALAARDATRNGDDSHTSGTGARRPWFEKMESVYSISNCTLACHVKFATCTLQGNALTWWNSHVKTTTPEAAHAMPWRTLKKIMTDKYCPRGEIKKLEFEMWNLKVKGTDVVTYSQRFQELALMCDRMFPEEIDQVEKYVGGLPDTIHGSVMATKPKTMQDAIVLWTKRSTLGPNVRLTTKESLMTPPGTTRISNQTRDKTLEELMPQEMVIGDHTKGLELCDPNVTITMMVLVLPNATSVTDLVIYLVTAVIPQMSTLGLIRGVALNVVIKGISRRIAQN